MSAMSQVAVRAAEICAQPQLHVIEKLVSGRVGLPRSRVRRRQVVAARGAHFPNVSLRFARLIDIAVNFFFIRHDRLIPH